MGPPTAQPVSSARYPTHDNGQRPNNRHPSTAQKRQAPASNVASADSSDVEDDDDGELPPSGLVAPWEVLRGLADVAVERARKVYTPLLIA